MRDSIVGVFVTNEKAGAVAVKDPSGFRGFPST